MTEFEVALCQFRSMMIKVSALCNSTHLLLRFQTPGSFLNYVFSTSLRCNWMLPRTKAFYYIFQAGDICHGWNHHRSMTKCLLIKSNQESVHHYMVVVPPFMTYLWFLICLSVPYLSSSTWQGVMMKYAKNMAAWVVCERIKEVILISGLVSGKRSRGHGSACCFALVVFPPACTVCTREWI